MVQPLLLLTTPLESPITTAVSYQVGQMLRRLRQVEKMHRQIERRRLVRIETKEIRQQHSLLKMRKIALLVIMSSVSSCAFAFLSCYETKANRSAWKSSFVQAGLDNIYSRLMPLLSTRYIEAFANFKLSLNFCVLFV